MKGRRLCDRCGSTTRNFRFLRDEVICKNCLEDDEGLYGDRLNIGFAMLQMGDDSVESDYFDDLLDEDE